MKSNWAIVQKYAESLLEVVNAEKKVDEMIMNLKEVTEMYGSSQDLQYLLVHPLIDTNKKLTCLEAILKKMKISKLGINFCKVLVKAERFELLPKILKEYERLSDLRIKRGKAVIKSAKPLTEENRGELLKRLEKKLGIKLDASWEEEANLLGGFVVQTGNKIFDYSVQGQLNRLEDKILKMRVQ